MKLTTIEVKGRKFQIDVLEGTGIFCATIDGDQVQSPTLEDLKSKLAANMSRKRVKLSIRACYWEQGPWSERSIGRLVKGTFTGIHARNSNLLFKADDAERAEQIDSYRSREFLPIDTANEYEALCIAYRDAAKAKQLFEETNGLDIRDLIKNGLAEQGETDAA